VKKPSLEASILMVLFFGPPLLVAAAVFGPLDLNWLPQPPTYHGELFDPPVALPETTLETSTGGSAWEDWALSRWSLIYASDSACEELCRQRLELLREVRLALVRERDWVQRVYLHGAGTSVIAEPGSDLTMGRVGGQAGREMRRVLGEERLRDGYIYIIDPLGQLVLSYPPDAEQQGILADLKRLIVIARIG